MNSTPENITQQPNEEIDLPPASDSSKPPSLIQGLTQVGKNHLLVVLIIIWALLASLNMISSISRSETKTQSPKKDILSNETKLYFDLVNEYNILYPDQNKSPNLNESVKKILEEPDEEKPLQKSEKKSSDNEEKNSSLKNLNIQFIDEVIKDYDQQARESGNKPGFWSEYVIILAADGEKEKAENLLKKHGQTFENPEISPLITNVYFSSDENFKNLKTQDLEYSARENLSGWFRDRTLLEIYQRENNKEKIKVLLTSVNSKYGPQYTRYIVFFIAFLAVLLLGSFATFILLILSLTIYWKNSLTKEGVRDQNNSIFNILTLERAIGIFLLWEFLRFFVSFAGFYFSKQICHISFSTLIFVSSIINYGVVLFIIFKLLKQPDGKLLLKSIGLQFDGIKKLFIDTILGVGGYMAAVPVILTGMIIYQSIFKSSPQSSNPIMEIIDSAKQPGDIILIFLIVGIIGPVFEEILFRGYLYTTLRRYITAFWAVIIVSLLFALIHFDPGAFFLLFLLGAVLAVLYEKSASLIPSIIVHCIWNSVVTLLVFNPLK